MASSEPETEKPTVCTGSEKQENSGKAWRWAVGPKGSWADGG